MRRSQGKATLHWASVMGKSIADQYSEESFIVLNFRKSECDCYCLKKDSATSIRVTNHLTVDINENDFLSYDMISDEKTQSWWKYVFFEEQGIIQYDNYYDSFRVTENSELTFGGLLEKITNGIHHIIKAFAKLDFDVVYIPSKSFLNSPLRYILQLHLKGRTRVLPEAKSDVAESQYVLQQYDADNAPVLSLAGGLSVANLLGGKSIIVHVPLDDESLSCHLIESTTWKDVLLNTADFSYQFNGISFQIVILDAQVDIFSNLFVSFSSGTGKTSLMVKSIL